MDELERNRALAYFAYCKEIESYGLYENVDVLSPSEFEAKQTNETVDCAAIGGNDCEETTDEPFECKQCGRMFCANCAGRHLSHCDTCQADICDISVTCQAHEHDTWGAR